MADNALQAGARDAVGREAEGRSLPVIIRHDGEAHPSLAPPPVAEDIVAASASVARLAVFGGVEGVVLSSDGDKEADVPAVVLLVAGEYGAVAGLQAPFAFVAAIKGTRIEVRAVDAHEGVAIGEVCEVLLGCHCHAGSQ